MQMSLNTASFSKDNESPSAIESITLWISVPLISLVTLYVVPVGLTIAE